MKPNAAFPDGLSGEKPDTNEHVIPEWLQRRFGLQRQTYHLPNETALAYRHVKVPAARKFNESFGQIEKRISHNQFVWEEIYLWFFKIHIGLMYRNAKLRSNISDRNSNPIILPQLFMKQLKIFRILTYEYINYGSFPTSESPPGSVFILPSFVRGHFDLIHSYTCGCIGINIGEFFVAASFWDFGMARDFGYFDWNWNPDHYLQPLSALHDQEHAAFYHHVHSIWLCNLGYWCYRWNINMYRIRNDLQPDMPTFEGEPFQRPEDPKELARICATFGLELYEFIPGGRSHFIPAASRIQATKNER